MTPSYGVSVEPQRAIRARTASANAGVSADSASTAGESSSPTADFTSPRSYSAVESDAARSSFARRPASKRRTCGLASSSARLSGRPSSASATARKKYDGRCLPLPPASERAYDTLRCSRAACTPSQNVSGSSSGDVRMGIVPLPRRVERIALVLQQQRVGTRRRRPCAFGDAQHVDGPEAQVPQRRRIDDGHALATEQPHRLAQHAARVARLQIVAHRAAEHRERHARRNGASASSGRRAPRRSARRPPRTSRRASPGTPGAPPTSRRRRRARSARHGSRAAKRRSSSMRPASSASHSKRSSFDCSVFSAASRVSRASHCSMPATMPASRV